MKFDIATPYTAVFVLVKKGAKVAFVLRANTGWSDGNFGLASGKVEKGEPFLKAAVREAEEEMDVKINPDDLNFVHVMHRNDPDSLWVDVYFMTEKWGGEPYNAEPEKAERLEWFSLDALPDNVVPPQRRALENIVAGRLYSEDGWE